MGEGSRPQHNKNSNQGSPTTRKAAHKGQREDNRKNAGRNTNRKTPPRGATAREEPRRRPKTNRGQGKHGPKQAKTGVQEGDRTTKRRAKDPHKATASGSRSLSSAKGLVAHGTEQVKKGHAKSKGEETKRRGIATSYPV